MGSSGSSAQPTELAGAVTEALPSMVADAASPGDDAAAETHAEPCVRRQLSLPDMVRRVRSSAAGCATRRRQRRTRTHQVIGAHSLTPEDPTPVESADAIDVFDGHSAFPRIGDMELQSLTENMLRIGGMFTPAASVLSMSMTVGSMSAAILSGEGEAAGGQVSNTRNVVSLGMETLGLGLWAGSMACPPLSVVATGLTAADWAVNVSFDFFSDNTRAA